MEQLKCDFCSEGRPSWRYPAKDFSWAEPTASVGDWAACDTCMRLIEAENRTGLAERSVKTFIAKHNWASSASSGLYKELADLHYNFFKNRKGEVIPLDVHN